VGKGTSVSDWLSKEDTMKHLILSKLPKQFALLTALTLLLSLSGSAVGQTTKATVLGVVTDANGSVIPNAKITAKNLNTGISRETTSDEAGRYRLPELPVGLYEITAEQQGFQAKARSGIDLTVGREAVVNFSLSVSGVEEKIIIEGDASLVETTSATLSYLVNRKQIEELPLNGRDVLQLATLQNGVISTRAITVDQGEAGAGQTRLAINGARINFNAYFLDGTETSDAFGNSPGGLGGGFLGVDALREFKVLTSNYSAEYGQGGGAVINAVTKSGSNEIHGTAFEFLRNSALDARNFFNAAKLPFKRNQFGGSLGAPIVKNQVFIFGSYEGLRRREGTSTIFNVPSPAARQGNLTSGQITVAESAKPYLALYPLPNGPVSGDTGIFRRDFNESTNEDFFTIRLDGTVTEKHSVSGRYTFDDSDLARVGGVIMNQVLTNRNQYLTLEEQSIFSPRALNIVRFGFNRSNFASDFPFTVPVSSNLAFVPGRQMGAFSLVGFTELRPALNAARQFVLNTFEINDQFVYSRGGHALKFGGMIRRYQLNANSPLVPDGIFIYGGGLDRFLTSRAQVMFVPQPGTDFYRGIRETLFGFYVQDDWKVRRNLTLNLGLRYEPISTPTEVNGRVANLRSFTATAPTIGDPYIDNPSKRNFGPRLGFAWDPTGSGKTAIRGGAGIFYSAILPMQYRFQISSVPPFARLVLLPGVFPDAFTRFINSPIPVPGLLWLTQFDAEQPTVYQWNLNIQHEVTNNFVVSGGYVGSRGVHLQTGDSANVRSDFQIVNGQKFFPAGSGPRVNPNFGTIQLLGFSADSRYHGLQLTATKRYAAGLQFQIAYTLAKSIDTGSSTESIFTNGNLGADRQDPFNPGLDRGLSDFDARHNFVANFLWDLPIGRKLTGGAGKLVKGWSLGGILSLRSGFPFSAVIGFDRARNGIDNVQSQRPDVVPGFDLSNAVTGNPNRYINPAAFQLQPAGFYGNAPRNGFTGPDLKVFDFTILKKTPITERISTEFRFEAFNLFNRTNFAPLEAANRVVFTGVNTSGSGIVPASFGQLTRTATTSRQLQFGLKLIW
jgi:hypothetical protein